MRNQRFAGRGGRLQLFLLLFVLSFPLLLPFQSCAEPSAPTAPAAPSGGATHRVDLDLGSTRPSVPAAAVAGVNSAPSGQMQIHVGGAVRSVLPSDMLTAAEFVALSQVLSTGRQTLVINAAGAAAGGRFALSPAMSPDLSNLVIPAGVTALKDFGIARVLNLSANLSNSGSFYAYSSNPAVNTATISASNINNSGLLTTFLPNLPELSITRAVANLNLSLSATGDIINTGTISSAGSLTAAAGRNAINALPAGAGGPSPIMRAVSGVNLQAAAIVNQGVLASETADVNVTTRSLINSGIIQAPGGSINITGTFNGLSLDNALGLISARDALVLKTPDAGRLVEDMFDSKALLTASGGQLSAKEIFFESPGGQVSVNVGQIDGAVHIAACNAAVGATHGDLRIVGADLTGDPIYFSGGDLELSFNPGTNSTGGSDFVALAGGNITTRLTDQATLDATGGGPTGGAITIAAGVTFSIPGGGSSPISCYDCSAAATGVTILGPSPTGGNVLLPNVSIRTQSNNVSVSATSPIGAGAKISLGSIYTSGAGATAAGTAGRSAGSITISAVSDIATGALTAGGGNGANGSSNSGGQGGNGGPVNISTSGGNIVVAGDISANGGGGGGGGLASAGGGGGTGANITLHSDTGMISVAGTVNSAGGGGGGGGGSIPGTTFSRGGNGGRAGSVNISSGGTLIISGTVIAAGGGGGGTGGSTGGGGGGTFGAGSGGGGDKGYTAVRGNPGGSAGEGGSGGSCCFGTNNGGKGGDVGDKGGAVWDRLTYYRLMDNGGTGGASGTINIAGDTIAVTGTVGGSFGQSRFADYSVVGGDTNLASAIRTTISLSSTFYDRDMNLLSSSGHIVPQISMVGTPLYVVDTDLNHTNRIRGGINALNGTITLNGQSQPENSINNARVIGGVVVREASGDKSITAESLLTAAEWIALVQRYTTGVQSLTVNDDGTAAGGDYSISASNIPSGGFTTLNLPSGVSTDVAVDSLAFSGDVRIDGTMTFQGNGTLTAAGLINYGTIGCGDPGGRINVTAGSGIYGTGIISAATVNLSAVGGSIGAADAVFRTAAAALSVSAPQGSAFISNETDYVELTDVSVKSTFNLAGNGTILLSRSINSDGDIILSAGGEGRLLSSGNEVTLSTTGTLSLMTGSGVQTFALWGGNSIKIGSGSAEALYVGGAGSLVVQSGADIATFGDINLGAGALSLTTTAGSINVGGRLTATAGLTLSTSGTGLITSAGDSATVSTAGTLSVTTGADPESVRLWGSGQIILGDGGTETLHVASAGSISLQAGTDIATSGDVDLGAGSLNLTTSSGGINVGGSLAAAAGITLSTSGTGMVKSAGGTATVSTAGTLSVTTGADPQSIDVFGNSSIVLGDGGTEILHVASAGSLVVQTGTEMATSGAIDMGAGLLSLTTTSGNITVGGNLTAAAGITLNTSGTGVVISGRDTATVRTTGPLSVTTGADAQTIDLWGAGTILLGDGGSGTLYVAESGSFALQTGTDISTSGSIDLGAGSLSLRTSNGTISSGGSLIAGDAISLEAFRGILQTPGVDPAPILKAPTVLLSTERGDIGAPDGAIQTAAFTLSAYSGPLIGSRRRWGSVFINNNAVDADNLPHDVNLAVAQGRDFELTSNGAINVIGSVQTGSGAAVLNAPSLNIKQSVPGSVNVQTNAASISSCSNYDVDIEDTADAATLIPASGGARSAGHLNVNAGNGSLTVEGDIVNAATDVAVSAAGTLSLSSGAGAQNIILWGGSSIHLGQNASETLNVGSAGSLIIRTGADISVSEPIDLGPGSLNLDTSRSISISSDIAAGGGITLAAHGDVNVATSGNLNAGSAGISLTSTSGAVCARPTSVAGTVTGAAATTFTLTTTGNGGPLLLGDVRSDHGTMAVAAGGALSVQPLSKVCANGTLRLTADADLQVGAGAQLTANDGNLILQDQNVTSGLIVIGDGTTVRATSTTARTTDRGNVYLIVGNIPSSPRVGRTPENVTLSLHYGGQAFFGANGIAAMTHDNNVTADGGWIVFNTGDLPADAIQLAGNVNISANAFRGATAHTLPPEARTSIAFLPDTTGAAGISASRVFPTSGGQVSTTILQTDSLPELAWPGPAGRQEQSGLQPFQLVVAADSPAAGRPLLGGMLFSGNGFSQAQQLSGLQMLSGHGAPARLFALPQGNCLVAPSTDIELRTEMGTVKIAAGAIAYVMNTGNGVAVFDLHDTTRSGVVISAGDRSVALAGPGTMAVLTGHGAGDFNQVDESIRRIAYRAPRRFGKDATSGLFLADFSITSALATILPLRQMRTSQLASDRAAFEQVLKNAAILWQVRAGAPYRCDLSGGGTKASAARGTL